MFSTKDETVMVLHPPKHACTLAFTALSINSSSIVFGFLEVTIKLDSSTETEVTKPSFSLSFSFGIVSLVRLVTTEESTIAKKGVNVVKVRE